MCLGKYELQNQLKALDWYFFSLLIAKVEESCDMIQD